MIDLHYWPTPNGKKISIALEEMGLKYTVRPVNIGRGEQFTPQFVAISPNNRIPAIVDHDPVGGGAPVAVFESGAILLYLAEKTGRFLPKEIRGRVAVTAWVMWQVSGLGPMAGQLGHFKAYAPEKIPYAIDRYTKEVRRLYAVLDRQLAANPFVAGDYSIADMAIWPWVNPEQAGLAPEDFPNAVRWRARVGERPGVQRGAALLADLRPPAMDDEAKKVLFGQDDKVVRR